jgi:hypothetical protein
VAGCLWWGMVVVIGVGGWWQSWGEKGMVRIPYRKRTGEERGAGQVVLSRMGQIVLRAQKGAVRAPLAMKQAGRRSGAAGAALGGVPARWMTWAAHLQLEGVGEERDAGPLRHRHVLGHEHLGVETNTIHRVLLE